MLLNNFGILAQVAKTAEVTRVENKTISGIDVVYIEVKVANTNGSANLTYGRFLNADEKALWDASDENKEALRKKVYSFAMKQLEARPLTEQDTSTPVSVAEIPKESNFDAGALVEASDAAIATQEGIISTEKAKPTPNQATIDAAEAELKTLRVLKP